ncbi:type IV-A pilus assembly ATPase PilB [Candidatus Endobugula sertula]|uniref:Type IV-A pilus assembly ATPase PilB n=1 Tax=Candidatus Endobugula sertula TaxID=62101 RepID=A0A1D2QP06_9GAMM|nr:type IV-A pilus assembly ATPase PilB [Candidatus Endobugula sertula]
MNAPALSGLAKRLVQDKLLNAEEAQNYLTTSKRSGVSFVSYLVKASVMDAVTLASIAAEEFGTPVYNLDAHNVSHLPTDLVDDRLIAKHQILPLFKRGHRLFLAVTDPTNLQALDDIKFNTGLSTDAILVEADKLEMAIETFLSEQEETLGETLGGLDEEGLADIDIDTTMEDDGEGDDALEIDEAPIVKFINKILLEAIRQGASDIHFEPYEKSYRIRFRTDGVLSEIQKPPSNLATRLAARLKVMSQMDISERRVPQDGRIKLKISRTKSIDFRVNTLPTLFGEKIVLRILDANSAKMGIDAPGYEDDQKELYMKTLEQPQGMILVTGPTGSGKTVSLYTGLNILNTSERNISTAEDPVEINLEGINQVQVNSRVGLTFAEALRSFLRQDPDVVMVGEIRDLETAEIGIKAAQTGHLVLSTLHTNSAAETLTRLLNMGVPTFNVATTVSLIIAQRLARRLCVHCRHPMKELPEEVMKQEGLYEENIGLPRQEWQLYEAKGCSKCNRGYKGRVGIYEVMRITPQISSLIMEGGNSIDIANQAKKEGFNNLRVSALRKVTMGLVGLKEANRVTKD